MNRVRSASRCGALKSSEPSATSTSCSRSAMAENAIMPAHVRHDPRRRQGRRGLDRDRGARPRRLRPRLAGRPAQGVRERTRARLPPERRRPRAGVAGHDHRRTGRRRHREPVLRRRRAGPGRRDGRARIHGAPGQRRRGRRARAPRRGRAAGAAGRRDGRRARRPGPRPAIWPISWRPACRSSCSTASSPGVEADSVLVRNAAGAARRGRASDPARPPPHRGRVRPARDHLVGRADRRLPAGAARGRHRGRSGPRSRSAAPPRPTARRPPCGCWIAPTGPPPSSPPTTS